MNFGESLKKFRTEKGYTLEKVGDLLGVSPQAVYRWESGKTEPNMKTVAKLCKIFNCTADELAGLYTQPLTRDERDLVVLFRDASPETQRIVMAILRGNIG